MAHAHDHAITAADYNALASAADYIYGVGNGDHGYGQSSPALPTLSADSVGAAAPWLTLRSVLTNICAYQNTSTAKLPPTDKNSAGEGHVAYGAGDPKSWPDLIALCDTNRLNAHFSNMTLTSSAASTTRSSTWDSYVQAGFSIDFGSENNARFFFNTGGELRIAFAHPDTSTLQDESWHYVLSNLNIAFKAHSTAKLSGRGTGSSIGYYDLTTDWQPVFVVYGTDSMYGGGLYNDNVMTVYAKADSITGENGAKGSLIYLYCNFYDEHTNAYYDLAQAGTTATLGHLRGTGSLPSPIAAPTCAVAVEL